MTWEDVIKIGLSAGVVAAAVNIAFGWIPGWIKEKNQARRAATYSAIRVAVILEEFAMVCAQQLSESAAYENSGGEMGAIHATLAPLGEYPSDLDWKALDGNLVARALSLRNEVRLSQGSIRAISQIEPEDEPNEFEEQAGKCGYRAWEISTEIRKKYSLPTVQPDRTHWDAIGLLKEHHDKALKRFSTDGHYSQ